MIQKKICPITYAVIDNNDRYALAGLKKLSPSLRHLNDLTYSAEAQRKEAQVRAQKLSIQGVQPKLSAKLNAAQQSFTLCDIGGNYILKPQHKNYDELPENEDLTMRLAENIPGKMIETPLHGLIYCSDGSLTYFIKRFDRGPRNQKIPLEDFSQLIGATRETKYDYSMERIITILDKYCTFPSIEKGKLFTRIIFNYLIGNEDMHLKNYSLITDREIVKLSPAYDFINTTIAIGINHVKEQIALSLNGKKNNLTRRDFIDYYGHQKLGLSFKIIDETLQKFQEAIPVWEKLIAISFLSQKNKEDYFNLLYSRIKILNIN